MTNMQKIILASSRDIPFNNLVLSQSNVRRVKAGISVDELAESIARRGLIQSLHVRPVIRASRPRSTPTSSMTKTARARASSGPAPTPAAATDRQGKGPGRKTGADGVLAINQATLVNASVAGSSASTRKIWR